jgi:hypothetical protein
MRFSEETLMAYADNELDGDTRAGVEAAMASDSDLADSIAWQIETRQALTAKLHAAFDRPLEEPVPARLLEAANSTPASSTASSGGLTDTADPRSEMSESSLPRWRLPHWSAIVVSLIVGVLIGLALKRTEAPFAAEGGRLTARGDLNDALSLQTGGAFERDTGIQMGVSFLAKNGDYCRTFTLKDESMLAGLACRRHSRWTIDALTRTNADASGAYRMAGAAIPALLLGIVESTIAGDPLDAEQEADARERGWQR